MINAKAHAINNTFSDGIGTIFFFALCLVVRRILGEGRLRRTMYDPGIPCRLFSYYFYFRDTHESWGVAWYDIGLVSVAPVGCTEIAMGKAFYNDGGP